ncbi:flagellar assembly protein FliW [Clostridium senegalense]|uniref:Flagellar assembly factor FliW n=1 Tax=Clostridium senegalense TaxID=1465809 RepID=A0A6M0GZ72_9CLOT|nr:flagellar assembly protein FliW [Clostridium senegalense]NEU03487.1 flagellar assembly protein FliW [Clostridium senegalense]
MELKTKYHGIVKYDEDEIITLSDGLLGFEHLKKYIIFSLKDNEDFKVIHSLEDESVGIVIMSPFLVMKNYEFNLSDKIVSKLKIKNEKEVAVYTTVTLNSDINKITTNLKAPIVLNISSNLGKQIIIDNESYNIKEVLFKENLKC